MDPYVFAKHVIEKQEVVSHLRRQYKSDLYDARVLENDLKDLLKLVNKKKGCLCFWTPLF